MYDGLPEIVVVKDIAVEVVAYATIVVDEYMFALPELNIGELWEPVESAQVNFPLTAPDGLVVCSIYTVIRNKPVVVGVNSETPLNAVVWPTQLFV